jgi:hypothetical protein
MAEAKSGTSGVSVIGRGSAAELGVNVVATGGAERRVNATRIAGELEHVCRRRGVTEGALRVTFTDANGPKGGRDQRCAITLRVPRRTALHAESIATTAAQAWRTARDVFEQRLQAFFAERRTAARRPKKYYIAQRLLR